MRTLKANDPRRDETLRSSRGPVWDKHPYGRFTLGSQPLGLDRLSSGSVADVVAPGTLRVHDVDRHVEFPLQVQLSGGRFEVAGRLRTTMTNFGFVPPSVTGLTTVRDGVNDRGQAHVRPRRMRPSAGMERVTFGR
jgi:hypothetical protein